MRRAGSSPWYQEIREESRDAKHSWRRAERKWLKPGFTVHHQIYSAAKRLLTTVVHKVKSRFVCTQIANSSSSKQLSTVCERFNGREKTSLPDTNPIWQFTDVFYDYLTRKVTDIRSDLHKQTPLTALICVCVRLLSFSHSVWCLSRNLRRFWRPGLRPARWSHSNHFFLTD